MLRCACPYVCINHVADEESATLEHATTNIDHFQARAAGQITHN